MEDVDGEETTPFWVQSATNVRRADRLRRGVSSLFFSSGLVILLLMVTAVCFLVFVVPSTLTFSAQIFRPNSVKKSWDSLNTVLVLVAVVFGFLSRIKNEDRYSYYDEVQPSHNKQNEAQKSNPTTSNQWYNYTTNEEQKPNTATIASSSTQWYEYPDYHNKLEHKDPILAKNGNSYPDLIEVSSTRWDYPRRFYDEDDIHVESGRVLDLGHLHRRHRSLGEPLNKPFFVDTLVVNDSKEDTDTIISPPNLSPPPAQPAADPPEFEEKPKKVKRTYENVGRRKERSRRKKVNKDYLEPVNPITEINPPVDLDSPELEEMPKSEYEIGESSMEKSINELNEDVEESTNPITTPPSPPPSPPPQQQKSSKRGNATKHFLNSLYHKNKKKKKKQRQKNVDDNLDSLIQQSEPPLSFGVPPPQPPSPPPPSVFQNLFSSKKHKRKRTITVSATLPTPPLPTPTPTPSEIESNSTQNPPEITETTGFQKIEENPNNSPLNRIPPPPPPPPAAFLKNPAWKFVVQGDYVRIDSATTSRSGSPELDDVDSENTPNAPPLQPSALFCPSPDVNTKAESFITNFRAKLKAEKIHSMKLGLSGLGPGPKPDLILGDFRNI